MLAALYPTETSVCVWWQNSTARSGVGDRPRRSSRASVTPGRGSVDGTKGGLGGVGSRCPEGGLELSATSRESECQSDASSLRPSRTSSPALRHVHETSVLYAFQDICTIQPPFTAAHAFVTSLKTHLHRRSVRYEDVQASLCVNATLSSGNGLQSFAARTRTLAPAYDSEGSICVRVDA